MKQFKLAVGSARKKKSPTLGTPGTIVEAAKLKSFKSYIKAQIQRLSLVFLEWVGRTYLGESRTPRERVCEVKDLPTKYYICCWYIWRWDCFIIIYKKKLLKASAFQYLAANGICVNKDLPLQKVTGKGRPESMF